MSIFNAENTTAFFAREKVQEVALRGAGEPIPQLHDIRRIPVRYRSMLPLGVMKQYRCAVIGTGRGILTVAVTHPYHPDLVEMLSQLTGYVIFPVCVRMERMDLLLRRVERWQHARRRGGWRLFQKELAPIHIVGALLSYRDRLSH